ncbi:hypothetical protein ILUMI_15297 [Ignelater luminosus]|uniref:Transposable element P transposase-like RNase H domain-containing protein n=1 Tax=Ignelater luminosus TaxID=2038154 RepID=A0A8K0CTB0_IGNLU|nr:hypothetical protein ILUMI_15297 [Ignelater luminosus]
MSIIKLIERTGKKFPDYIDLGTNLDADSLPEAKEILVFIMVAINSSWKIPTCLEVVSEANVILTSFTFDGTATNLSVVSILGAQIEDPTNLKSESSHSSTADSVSFYLDPCHMIKLTSNCLASKRNLTDAEKGEILWKFFENRVHLKKGCMLPRNCETGICNGKERR